MRRALALGLLLSAPSAGRAQRAELDGPLTLQLATATPAFTARAVGFPSGVALRYTLLGSTSIDFLTGVVLDTTFVSSETVVPIQVTRVLPSEASLFFRVRVTSLTGVTDESPLIGPRIVPTWLTLLSPNSPTGDQLDTRRPLFVWRSAVITPQAGPWRYDVEITSNGRPVGGTSGITDTTFRIDADLESNASYRWSVRAYLPRGESIRAASVSTFGVSDPELPTVTLLFQNFPNPFPSPTSFATCFWFDLAPPGGHVTLDLLDLRGNLVRNLIPGLDGQTEFPPGRYGRGAPGAGTNCDGRFIWDATGNDGRTVAPGVYIARFRVGNGAPTFRSILFRGR
ncbi:MAG: hypothetical protein ABIW79_01265 [Gemmatimonas sp.]